MKIGIVTFHKALSYGACIQAYATEYILKKVTDHADVEFVDYENAYEARQKGWGFLKRGTWKERISTLAKRVLFKNEFYKKRAFEDFHYAQPKSEVSTNDRDKLQFLKYDVLVAGSDQIWNPQICNEIEPVFLLDFGIAARRISIASSMGGYRLTEEERTIFKNRLRMFDAISVREEHTANEIRKLTDKEIHIMLDPTLLLSKKEWRDIYTQESIRYEFADCSYILAFTIGNITDEVKLAYRYYSQKYNLPVYRIMLNSYKPQGIDKVIAGPTPYEFLSLIDHAAFVITNSFHGMAFSVNFNKNFIQIPVRGNNERMKELLDFCGLSDQMLVDGDFENVPCEINFDRPNLLLEERRKCDLRWIKEKIYE